MRIRLSCCGQSVIEYLLLVTAVMVVLLTGIIGNSYFSSSVEKGVGMTQKFIEKHDDLIQFVSNTGASISKEEAVGTGD
ncbi:MAG: hypothetical protein V2A70_05200 [Candidatus Omnitrophota bacterium]